ncbi:hypothetical protein AVEN_165026-1 [Araneus ventricosus]|uniref:Uncharacterized protein n=1 Tax=Araneus ventricosus TaxID=182803 RepID=A0A4Y2GLJ3_ARAVE|nr:hypothetical protein AVEN_165026-1 [Araneus ventricosus]
MRAVQKRANNTTGTEQTRYQLFFSRTQALYKKLFLRDKRTSLKNFCTQTKYPYGIPFKAIAENNTIRTFQDYGPDGRRSLPVLRKQNSSRYLPTNPYRLPTPVSEPSSQRRSLYRKRNSPHHEKSSN